MRFRFVVGLGILFAAGMSLAQDCNSSPKQRAKDMAAIEQLHAQDLAAGKAGDVRALAALWTEDAVALPPDHKPIIGGKDVREWVLANKPDFSKFDLLELANDFHEVHIVCDYAFEWATGRLSFRAKGSNDVIHISSKLMRILQRQPDGSWKVARSLWNSDPPVTEHLQVAPEGK